MSDYRGYDNKRVIDGDFLVLGAIRASQDIIADYDGTPAILSGSGTAKMTSDNFKNVNNSFNTDANGNINCNDITVANNMTVQGTTTTVNTVDLLVSDPIINLAHNNIVDYNVGIVGTYNTNSYRGLVFDKTAVNWKFFNNESSIPDKSATFSPNLADISCNSIVGSGSGNIINFANNCTLSGSEVLTNKSFTHDSCFFTSGTKKLRFDVSAIADFTTRTITYPSDTSMTLVGTDSVQTLSNKTFSSNILPSGTVDLGATGSKFQDLYLSSSIITGNHIKILPVSYGTIKIGNGISISMNDNETNTIIGTNACKNATSCIHTTAIGHESFGLLTTGNNNTTLGSFSGLTINTGNNNTCIGYSSGVVTGTNSFGVAIGDNATSRTYGIALGKGAICTNNNQMMIGSTTLSETITAIVPAITDTTDLGASFGKFKDIWCGGNIEQSIIRIGSNLGANKTSSNILIGPNCGANLANTANCNNNVAIGPDSMANGTGSTAAFNVCLGQSSGYNLINGDFNVCLGSSSGSSITDGHHNIMIGYNANLSSNSLSHCIALGHNSSATANNQMKIGSNSLGDTITDILPGLDYTTNIGSSSLRFKNIYANQLYNTTTISTTPTTPSVLNNALMVDTSSIAITINLPAASSYQDGYRLSIKDKTGNAGTNNITIDPNASETIDGATTFVMNSNWMSLDIMTDGTNWFVIS